MPSTSSLTALTTVLFAAGAADLQAVPARLRLTLRLSLATVVLGVGAFGAAGGRIIDLFGASYAGGGSVLFILSLVALPLTVKAHFIAVTRIERRVSNRLGARVGWRIGRDRGRRSRRGSFRSEGCGSGMACGALHRGRGNGAGRLARAPAARCSVSEGRAFEPERARATSVAPTANIIFYLFARRCSGCVRSSGYEPP